MLIFFEIVFINSLQLTRLLTYNSLNECRWFDAEFYQVANGLSVCSGLPDCCPQRSYIIKGT